MILDSNNLERSIQISTQVCIVGGGVAGIVLATELSKHLDDIVLLESGTDVYNQDVQDLYQPAVEPDLYPNPGYSRLRFLGGSSNHWENNTSPLDPIDFEKRKWLPNSGWPISFNDVDPYYIRAAQYCGTEGDGYTTRSWMEKLGLDDVLQSSDILETGIAKAASPPVRFFEKFGDNLKHSDSIKLYTNANLVDIKYNQGNHQITRLYFRSNGADARTHEVRAKVVIFAMGGIENARMLLQFNQEYNNQLGNQGDNVGRYFMDHPLVRAAILYGEDRDKLKQFQRFDLENRFVVAFLKMSQQELVKQQVLNVRMPLIPQSNYVLSDGISSYHILSDSLGQGEIPENFGQHLGNFFSDIDMVAEAVARKKWDTSIFDDANEFGGFQVAAMLEQSPDRDNRIYLSDMRDKFGIPKIVIDWEMKQHDKDGMWKSMESAARGIGALSLGRLRLLREREDRFWDSQLSVGHHHMGTTRMGESSDTGVVDSNQKVFGTDNLYIAGSSVFTTGGHVPPTLTIVALSIRLAEHITGELS